MSEEHQKKSFSVPAHIAIIMDGNGRWAKRRGLPRNAGHKQGAKAFENICDYCQKIGVKYVTAYAFSTENWKRPQSEVDASMITVCVALNYGGRAEIVHSARELAQMAARGELDPDSIDERLFERHLYTAGIPDPDLLIRPSGELRLSNFLLWQLAYTEFVFQDVLWPDFTPAHLDQAIAQYAKRNRRFGGI